MADLLTFHRGGLTARDAGNAGSKLLLSYRTVRPRSLSAIENAPILHTNQIQELRPQYRPLDFANYETRFLELSESSRPDVPSCSLRHGSLMYPPDYVGLSYAWGDAKETTSIVLDGKLVRVSANLKAALQQMLSEGITRVWVDALCIDQANLHERGSQISLMGKIYAKATKVVAWLGLPSDDSEIAMRYFQEAADRRRYGIVGGNAIMSAESLSRLFARPYWQRMWIVQELAKAKEVEIWCGSDHVSWSDMAEMDPLQWLQGRERMLLENIQHFRSREQDSRVGFARMLLSEALIYTNSLKATDSRDKIYALLGLTLDGSDVVPTPSYDTDAIEVFRQTSSFMIQEEGQTSLILLAGRRQNCSDLPSWLPIWCETEKRRHRSASNSITTSKPYPSQEPMPTPDWISRCVRAGRETSKFATIVAGNSLELRAVRLERITEPTQPACRTRFLSHRFWRWHTDRSLCVMLELWEFFILGHTRKSSCRLTRPEDSPFWTKDRDSNLRKGLLLAHIFDAKFNQNAFSPFGIINRWFRRHRYWQFHEHNIGAWVMQYRRRVEMLAQIRMKTGLPNPLFDESFKTERNELRKLCPALYSTGMHTVMTSGGAFRLVYQETGPIAFSSRSYHDTIYRLENCALPVVLRRVSSKYEPPRFTLIGEVFLSIQDDFGHWTKNTGWTDDDFHEDAWERITII